MAITAQEVAKLREITGAGMMDCKRALTDAEGSFDNAVKILREKGIATGKKLEGRSASEGVVGSYIHHNHKLAALVEVNCETDFVARNEEFQALAKELALQVVSANPTYVRADEIPAEILEREREIALNLARNEGRPEAALPKIVEGRVKKWVEENCLLTQASVRDPKKSVGDLVTEVQGKLRENIQVRRFIRYKVGEGA